MRRLIFKPVAFKQYQEWENENPKIFSKINELLNVARNTPFTGIGKPEPLKHQLRGYWSRRINKEHRLVYEASEDAIVVISCRYHY